MSVIGWLRLEILAAIASGLCMALAWAPEPAQATPPSFAFYLGGEGIAEPPDGRCRIAGGILRCTVHATGTTACRANQRIAISLGRLGPARSTSRCASAPRPAPPARTARRLSGSGFNCRVVPLGRGIAVQTILQCSSRSGNGFATNGAVVESLTPALTARAGQLVRIDRGVGPIELGQTEGQVRRLLPPPSRVSRFVWDSTQAPGIALTFAQISGELIVELGAGRVVSITTSSPRFRTAAGIGVQSPLSAAARLSGFAPEACTGGYSNEASGGPASTTFAGGGFADDIASVRVSAAGWVTC